MNITLPIHSSLVFGFFLKYGGKISLLSLCVFSLTNCGGSASSPAMAPMVSIEAAGYGGLNRKSVSTVNRTVVKTGSLTLKTNDVLQAGEAVEKIVVDSGGFMTSMSERDDKSKYANFEIRVLAQYGSLLRV